jgi:DNA-binding NtrC family response regulator
VNKEVIGRTPTVLVVDDESLIRWSVSEALKDRGYAVAAAETAAEASLLAAAVVPFDVILLDLRLPDSVSVGVLEHLRRSTPTSRIIMMTAYGTPSIAERCQELGVGLIPKPFHLSDIVAAVDAAS